MELEHGHCLQDEPDRSRSRATVPGNATSSWVCAMAPSCERMTGKSGIGRYVVAPLDEESGRYMVRQMGVIVVAGQPVMGVSILANPGDGSFTSGTNQVDAVAGWPCDHFDAFPHGHC